MNRSNDHAASRLATLFILVIVTTAAPAFAQNLNIAQTEVRLEPVRFSRRFTISSVR